MREDAVRNLIGRRGDGPVLMLGSHLDTVVDAGRYDGPLGVLIAIEAAARVPQDLEVVGFADEEGVRFGTAYLGSSAMTGRFDPAWLDLRDGDVRLGDLVGELGPARDDVLGYVEVHIEQGPVLERLDEPVGVVTAIAGQSHAEVTFVGEAGHAGTVPMEDRRDALTPPPSGSSPSSGPAGRWGAPTSTERAQRDPRAASRSPRPAPPRRRGAPRSRRAPARRGAAIATRRGVTVDVERHRRPARRGHGRAADRGVRRRRPAAQRRRARRRDDGPHRPRRDAVRPLPRPASATTRPSRSRRPTWRSPSTPSSASCVPSDLLIRGATVVLPGVVPVEADVAIEGIDRGDRPELEGGARRSTPAACTCCPA